MRRYIINATLILPEEIIRKGALLLEDDIIASVCPDSGHHASEIVDLEGDYLMPGLIDLHGDAIEHELNPRPKAHLPMDHAIAQGDRKCALAGITTMFHAIGFHGDDSLHRNSDAMMELSRRIRKFTPHALIDSKIHCRFEMPVPSGMTCIQTLVAEGVCELVSLNDHTPGQGQYRDTTGIRMYLKEHRGMTDEQIEKHINERIALSENAEAYGQQMAEYALSKGLPLASHDDEDAKKINRRFAQGATISEFPLSVEAGETARYHGMHAIVGSPNVMRGGSTGTGARAIDMVAAGLADCLCSDYAPSTLLPAIFRIARELDWPLHRPARLTSLGPATAARLADRGAIREGLRADLIAVHERGGVPVTRHLWSAGRPTLITG
jgi:alpha-D-ribose 1-methylphosphonate 5-triphosphate diphosphatase